MSETSEKPEFRPGLEGVPCAKSSVSRIDGQEGRLYYRGYTIEDLSEHCSYEEVAYLLLYGDLPNREQLRHFDARLRRHRQLKYPIYDLLRTMPGSAHPMDVLQAGATAMGTFHPIDDVKDEAVQDEASVRLIAALPTLVAAHARMSNGDEPLRPRDDLDHATNFLYMLNGEEPTPIAARTMDVALILHAEHTMNASTFTARAVGSTLADPYSVVSSAVGSLSGPLHGGANERVLRMLDQIGTVDEVDRFVEERVARKERIMGLGHRVYKAKDPRATILQRLANELFDQLGRDERYEIACRIEEVALDKLGSKGVYPNVDFFSGLVYSRLGFPMAFFTPVFALARVSGWLAHWREQLVDNRIFRPTQIYVGHEPRTFVPMNERS